MSETVILQLCHEIVMILLNKLIIVVRFHVIRNYDHCRKYKQAASKLKTLGKEKDSQIFDLQKTLSRLTENEVEQGKSQVRI